MKVVDVITTVAGTPRRKLTLLELIVDIGAMYASNELRQAQVSPLEMQAKISVLLPVANAAAAAVLAELAASTLNLPPDLSLVQIASIQGAVDLPADFYIEAPDAPGRIRPSPRNGSPRGTHLERTTVALSRQQARRARICLETLRRSGGGPSYSVRSA